MDADRGITQEVFSEFPNEHYQNFESYPQFTPQQQFPGPPTPPNQHPAVHGAAPVAAPPLGPVPNGAVKTHPADIVPLTKTEPGLLDSGAQRGGSNSDEDDLTPAQSRRKAQNRAA